MGTVIFNEDEERFELNHLYAYSANNPLKFIDPFGLNPLQCSDDKKDKKDCNKTCKGSKGKAKALCLLVCALFGMDDDDPRDPGRIDRPDHNPTPIPAPRKPNPIDPDKKKGNGI